MVTLAAPVVAPSHSSTRDGGDNSLLERDGHAMWGKSVLVSILKGAVGAAVLVPLMAIACFVALSFSRDFRVGRGGRLVDASSGHEVRVKESLAYYSLEDLTFRPIPVEVALNSLALTMEKSQRIYKIEGIVRFPSNKTTILRLSMGDLLVLAPGYARLDVQATGEVIAEFKEEESDDEQVDAQSENASSSSSNETRRRLFFAFNPFPSVVAVGVNNGYSGNVGVGVGSGGTAVGVSGPFGSVGVGAGRGGSAVGISGPGGNIGVASGNGGSAVGISGGGNSRGGYNRYPTNNRYDGYNNNRCSSWWC
eukprot:TRINITY_DN8017_c1_g1_i1.p1 TRINITY_DN8017_c1_g1~~TRINITY_DN8017_c1_g1_i1.p1  ORF type:complete len:308 (+),score=40.22 TRINITY_DN8017_c1_g1_i1:139-1062(+)